MDSLQRVIDIKTSQAALAADLSTDGRPVKQQNVSSWLKTRLPSEYVIKVSEAVEYKVTPHELRPDLYPHPQDGLPAHLREARAA